MDGRLRTVLGTVLAGVFMGGLFTIQAAPKLAPVRVLGESATVLVFIGAFVSGLLMGVLSPGITRGLFIAVISIVLGLAIAGVVLILPVATGIIGQIELVSVSIVERMLVLSIVLAPVGVLGAFVGSFIA
ncbi:MAG: hypothetical protein AB1774_03365 [Bacillota bacterium]